MSKYTIYDLQHYLEENTWIDVWKHLNPPPPPSSASLSTTTPSSYVTITKKTVETMLSSSTTQFREAVTFKGITLPACWISQRPSMVIVVRQNDHALINNVLVHFLFVSHFSANGTPPSPNQSIGSIMLFHKQGHYIKTKTVKMSPSLLEKGLRAIQWLHSFPITSMTPELYKINCKSLHEPFTHQIFQKARDVKDITLLYRCGPLQRSYCHAQNITTYDKVYLVDRLPFISNKDFQLIRGISWINNEHCGLNIMPRKLSFRPPSPFSFHDYGVLDFETAYYPEYGRSLVFMIGCTLVRNAKVVHEQWTVDRIDPSEEHRIVQNWMQWIDDHKLHDIAWVHWSNAENAILLTLHDQYSDLIDLHLVDLLPYFMKNRITIKHCFDYKLKNIGKALFAMNYIEHCWDFSDIQNGLEAMNEAKQAFEKNDQRMIAILQKYNYFDTLILHEIIEWMKKYYF